VKENTERELANISRQFCQAARNIFRRFLDYPQKQEVSTFEISITSIKLKRKGIMESSGCRNICDSHGAKGRDTIK
jgi:Holliday junction resolvasome RuvABC ATP-dependent DNA helicase subunit